MDDKTLQRIAGDDEPDEDAAALPKLTVEQARYLSFAIEIGLEPARGRYEEETGEPVPEAWYSDPEFKEARRLLDADRKVLWKAMSMTLFGPAFRALLTAMENPKTALKAVELLSKTHGTLIERHKQDDPGQIQALFRILAKSVAPQALPRAAYNTVEGEFRDVVSTE